MKVKITEHQYKSLLNKNLIKESYGNAEIIANKFFNVGKTGMPFYDSILENPEYFLKNKEIKFSLVYMSPDEYIKKVSDLQGINSDEQNKNISISNLQKIINLFKSGIKIDVPIIEFFPQKAQEGRHRAFAAKELGLKLIPVYIFYRQRPN